MTRAKTIPRARRTPLRVLSVVLGVLAFAALLLATPLSTGDRIDVSLAEANYSERTATVASVESVYRGGSRLVTTDGSRFPVPIFGGSCSVSDPGALEAGDPVVVSTLAGRGGYAPVESLGSCGAVELAERSGSSLANPYVDARVPALVRPLSALAFVLLLVGAAAALHATLDAADAEDSEELDDARVPVSV